MRTLPAITTTSKVRPRSRRGVGQVALDPAQRGRLAAGGVEHGRVDVDADDLVARAG